MNKGLFLVFIIYICVFATSCTSKNSNFAKIEVKTPYLQSSKLSATSTALPVDKKICFGINVSAEDISKTESFSCGPQLSYHVGFVEPGGILSLEIAKGPGRKFEIFVYTAPTGTSCPEWSSSFNTVENFSSVYLSGSTTQNIENDFETVAINLDFPGDFFSNSVAAKSRLSCGATAQLRGQLDSSGQILNTSGSPFVSGSEFSDPKIQSFFKSIAGQYDLEGLGKMISSNIITLDATEIGVPEFVSSITRKPDSQKLYGLLHDGQLVEINSVSGTIIYLSSPGMCPFDLIECKVPMWIQSVSAGYGNEIFGLDHAGNIYQLSSSADPVPTGDVVEPNITQVSYY